MTHKNTTDRLNYIYNIKAVEAEKLFHSESFVLDTELACKLIEMYGGKDKLPKSIIEDKLRSVCNIDGGNLSDAGLLRVACGITFYDQHTYNLCLILGYSSEDIATVFNTTVPLATANGLLQARINCFTPEGEAIIPKEQAYKEKVYKTK